MRFPMLLAAVLWCAGCGSSGGPGEGANLAGGTDDGQTSRTDARVQLGDTAVSDAHGCQRVVDLQAVTIADPEPFDVIIVADHSGSLTWSRDSLAAGLRNLLREVHGSDARFFVLTPTQYGASSKDAVSLYGGEELVVWKDPVTGQPYPHEMTSYEQTCSIGEHGSPMPCPAEPMDRHKDGFFFRGTWKLAMPTPIATIKRTMSAAELAAQEKKIGDTILALGSGGAQREQPICTLNRYIAQDRSVLPKHAVFVVLSDEDDVSDPKDCLAEYTYQLKAQRSTEACSEDCPSNFYSLYKPSVMDNLEFSCVPVDDRGTEHPENAFEKSLMVNRLSQCTVGTTSTCTAGEIAQATIECGAGAVAKQCKRACRSTTPLMCQVELPNDDLDLCQPNVGFDYEGKHWASLLEYCQPKWPEVPGAWGNCNHFGTRPSDEPSSAFEVSEKRTPVNTALTSGESAAMFKAKADQVFGHGAYSVESIILDPSFSCPVHSGQSHGTTLRTLASSPEDVFSFCEDYAPALDRVGNFAQRLVQTQFSIELEPTENVEGLRVVDRAGASRPVPKGRYRFADGKLRVDDGIITTNDAKLEVDVEDTCRPLR